jgi:hypothetical protein
MTASSPTSVTPPRPLGRRLWNVARLHAANPFTIFYTPLLVVGLIFVLSLVIWWLVRTLVPSDPESVAEVGQGFQYSGAGLWVFVYMMVVAIMAMNYSFSFALGFGSTRRDYVLGTILTFVGLSALYSVVYALLAAVEEWTDGWGLGGSMFTLFVTGVDVPWWVRLFHVFALFVFFFSIGSVFGAIYVRGGPRTLILFFAVLALVLVGAIALLTVTESWGAFGDFFATVGLTGVYALSLVVSAVAAGSAYLVLQKATPRS